MLLLTDQVLTYETLEESHRLILDPSNLLQYVLTLTKTPV